MLPLLKISLSLIYFFPCTEAVSDAPVTSYAEAPRLSAATSFFCVNKETTIKVIKLSGMDIIPGLFKGMGAVAGSNPYRIYILGERRIIPRAETIPTKIEAAIPLEVVFHDEDFSSKEAVERMKEMGVKKNKRSQVIDQVSAVLILQDFLGHRSI